MREAALSAVSARGKASLEHSVEQLLRNSTCCSPSLSRLDATEISDYIRYGVAAILSATQPQVCYPICSTSTGGNFLVERVPLRIVTH